MTMPVQAEDILEGFNLLLQARQGNLTALFALSVRLLMLHVELIPAEITNDVDVF